MSSQGFQMISLIDDRGVLWPAQSRQLRAAFDSPYSGGEFVEYAVANLGFVAVDRHGSACHIRARPAMVGDATWQALCAWIGEARDERAALSWLGTAWQTELHRPPHSALTRLEALIGPARLPRHEAHIARRVTGAELHPRSVLGEIVRQWPDLSQPAARPALLSRLHEVLGTRYLVLRRDERHGRLVFHEFGDGIFRPYQTWRDCALGAPLAEMPDRAYGRWVEQCYALAWAAGEPLVEDVDAVVQWPHAGPTRMRYKRVVLPLQEAAGPPKLLGGSFLDDRIDLRVRA